MSQPIHETPETLTVFDRRPRITELDEAFNTSGVRFSHWVAPSLAKAPAKTPATQEEIDKLIQGWKANLRTRRRPMSYVRP
jgi:hypothetical protein